METVQDFDAAIRAVMVLAGVVGLLVGFSVGHWVRSVATKGEP